MFRYQELLAGQGNIATKFLFLALLVWTIFWKGLALYRSARNSQRYWFVALLIVNTLGVLEIIYLAFFHKKQKKSKSNFLGKIGKDEDIKPDPREIKKIKWVEKEELGDYFIFLKNACFPFHTFGAD